MYDNFKKSFINLKIAIINNLKIIIFFQIISALLSIIYFYNATTNYTYTSIYKNSHAETYENGTYLLNTIYPAFYPHNMNYFDLDFFYKIVHAKEFSLTDECKVSGYDKNTFLSTKNDSGYSFDFVFDLLPELTVNFTSSNKNKAKKCVEEFTKKLMVFENNLLETLKQEELLKTKKLSDLEKKVTDEIFAAIKEMADLKKTSINAEPKLTKEINNFPKGYRDFFVLLNDIRIHKKVFLHEPKVISSGYKNIQGSKDIIYIIIIFFSFSFFVSAIIILIKDYKL